MINVNMTDKAGVTLATAGKYCADNVKVTPSAEILRKDEQAKTATPTTSAQDITPDAGKALSKVTVNPITAAIVGDLDADSFAPAIVAAVEGKGVTVPDGTLLDGMAALIESIEAGGGGAGNIATGSFTNSAPYNISSLNVMTINEWVTNYGAFPTTLYAAYFDENPGEITSGNFPLYCASCIVDGNAQICYATVYSSTNISYVKKTNIIAQANKNAKTIQLISPSSTYNFKTGRTYRWVIVW